MAVMCAGTELYKSRRAWYFYFYGAGLFVFVMLIAFFIFLFNIEQPLAVLSVVQPFIINF